MDCVHNACAYAIANVISCQKKHPSQYSGHVTTIPRHARCAHFQRSAMNLKSCVMGYTHTTTASTRSCLSFSIASGKIASSSSTPQPAITAYDHSTCADTISAAFASASRGAPFIPSSSTSSARSLCASVRTNAPVARNGAVNGASAARTRTTTAATIRLTAATHRATKTTAGLTLRYRMGGVERRQLKLKGIEGGD
uniref:Uncharacterized protein n=1 Tax=Micromonas pusilla TaxID=38833 RepID=A0A7R9TKF4_MICPS